MKNKWHKGDAIIIIAWLALLITTFTQYGVQGYYKIIIWGISPIVVVYYIVKIVRGLKHNGR